MRKIPLLLICLCMALIFVTVHIDVQAAVKKTSADYKDLQDLDIKMKANVDKWLDAGVIQGVAEDWFGLNETITRAEFAKIVALAVDLKIDTNLKSSSFVDVKADDPVIGNALSYIEALRQAGVTDGVDQERFNPIGEVTKEQFAVLMVRSLGKDGEAQQTLGVMDVSVSDYAKRYVALALKMFPYLQSEGSYEGSIPITRQLILLGLDDLMVRYCGCEPSKLSESLQDNS
ncbi:Endo-1,4-beta-xylanase A precursor [compost metagenome]